MGISRHGLGPRHAGGWEEILHEQVQSVASPMSDMECATSRWPPTRIPMVTSCLIVMPPQSGSTPGKSMCAFGRHIRRSPSEDYMLFRGHEKLCREKPQSFSFRVSFDIRHL